MIEDITNLFWDENFRHWFFWTAATLGFFWAIRGGGIKDIFQHKVENNTHYHYGKEDD